MTTTGWRTFVRSLLQKGPLPWVWLGFLLVYLSLMIVPIFLSAGVMSWQLDVPAEERIGRDLQTSLRFSQAVFVEHRSPYIGSNTYPPLASILLGPLFFMGHATAYKVITVTTVVLLVVIVSILPLGSGASRHAVSALALALIPGLFSYGFRFELERGQFNVITSALCYLGIWLFHNHRGRPIRLLAYALFTVSIQLKLYPLVFAPMFIAEWRDWKANVKTVVGLAAVNIALLFVMGRAVFWEFLERLLEADFSRTPWLGNHSAFSFATLAKDPATGWSWLPGTIDVPALQAAIQVIAIAAVLIIMFTSWRRRRSGLDPRLLVACATLACILPPLSHDYRLSILIAPVALAFVHLTSWAEGERSDASWLGLNVLAFILAAAYGSTLVSFVYKPATLLLQNNLPALLVILASAVALSLLIRDGAFPNADGRQAPDPAESTDLSTGM